MGKYKFETLQIHAGQEKPDSATDARAVPIYLTSSYVFKDSETAANRFALSEGGNIYGRLTNPTESVLEERVSALEGGVGCLAVASGASAIYYSILNITKAGDNIVAAKNVYGGTYNLLANLLPDYGIKTKFVDINNYDELENAIDNNTKLVFAETLGNPNSDITNIEKVSKIAHKNGIPLIVDNTFATPFLFRPIEHGADIVVHSGTKFICGHGTALGGLIVDGGNFDWEQNDKFPGLSKPNPSYHGIVFSKAVGKAAYVVKIRATLLRDTGAAISPVNAFVLLQGLETLSLRVERHVFNALKVIEFLKTRKEVKSIHHPSLESGEQKELYDKYFPDGAGSIFTFELNGSEEKARKFTESLKLFSLLANVADVKSLVIHPASTTHSQLTKEELYASNITETTVRLSIGTEHIDDIIDDLILGFESIK